MDRTSVQKNAPSDPGTAASEPNPKVDDQKGVTISAVTKARLAKTVTDAIEKLVMIANVLKTAPDAPEGQDAVPGVLVTEVGDIIGILEALGCCAPPAEATAKMEHGMAAKVLREVAEVAMSLAEWAADNEITPEFMQKVGKLHEMLGSLTGEYPAAAAKSEELAAPPVDKEEPAEVPAVPVVEAAPAPAVAQPDAGLVESLKAASLALAAAVAKLAPVQPVVTPEPAAAPSPFDKINERLEQLAKSVEVVLAKNGPPPTADPKRKADQLELENRELKARLDKALEDPPKRASHQTADKPEPTTRLFPLYYNNSVYDPSVES